MDNCNPTFTIFAQAKYPLHKRVRKSVVISINLLALNCLSWILPSLLTVSRNILSSCRVILVLQFSSPKICLHFLQPFQNIFTNYFIFSDISVLVMQEKYIPFSLWYNVTALQYFHSFFPTFVPTLVQFLPNKSFLIIVLIFYWNLKFFFFFRIFCFFFDISSWKNSSMKNPTSYPQLKQIPAIWAFPVPRQTGWPSKWWDYTPSCWSREKCPNRVHAPKRGTPRWGKRWDWRTARLFWSSQSSCDKETRGKK